MPLLDRDSQPYGYRCNTCSHVWDAYHPPMGNKAAIEAAMEAWKTARCPVCASGGPNVVNPRLYARLKTERAPEKLGRTA